MKIKPLKTLFTNTIPNQIVHYSRGEPFRSITSVGREQIQQVVSKLDDKRAWGLARFSDPKYISQRFETEKILRQRFIEIGGRPTLHNPIYFFLGRHPIFESHDSNIGYSIELKDIDPYSVSFTYGDSMFSLIEENRELASAKYSNPLCAEIFWLETLPLLFSHPSFPKFDPLHVEVQLWVKPNLEAVEIVNRSI